jgi:DNA-binding transcriptional MerR regulator
VKDVESERHGIGEIARRSGLTVSALRFYDGIGVLVPVEVDERSGYRRYSDEQIAQACLLARLRRVAMPIDGIRQVLAARDRPELAGSFLDAHLRRLEKGVADARRELSAARNFINSRENLMPTWVTVSAAELAAGLTAVHFAAGRDPEHDILRGVLLDAQAGRLTMVATDRYRMAIASVPAALDGPPVQLVVPSAEVGQIVELLTGADEAARISLTADQVTLHVGDRRVVAAPLIGAYPDYRRLIPATGRTRVDLDERLTAGLRADTGRRAARHQDDAGFPLAVIALGPDGELRALGSSQDPGRDPEQLIGVNQEFLLEAVNARAGHQLRLELDGPLAPLVLRSADRPEWLSLLMPVRVPQPAGPD